MTLPTYTAQQLLARIKTLPEHLPISCQMELSKHHDSHRDHWVKWLREYDGPGWYGRKNHKRDAEYIWTHLQCAPMLVYLAEAAGVETNAVQHAFIHCAHTRGNRSAIAAAARRILPWGLVAKGLWPA